MKPTADSIARVFVITAGLCWTLSACLAYQVALRRSAPFEHAISDLLFSLVHPGLLWLSGFGACRGFLRLLAALGLGAYLCRAFALCTVMSFSPSGLGISDVLVLSFLIAATYVGPTTVALILLLDRPPIFLHFLEHSFARTAP